MTSQSTTKKQGKTGLKRTAPACPCLDGFITVEEAARMIGKTPQTVRNLIREGVFGAVRKGKQFLIVSIEFKLWRKNNGSRDTGRKRDSERGVGQ